mmetsp:Transcript_1426/g.5530  ORF Transcript_1426/g.5530 Transcript_1426/m.5530 type:complete len:303 (+) Transcript_1426:286-1194(+)
MSTTNGRACVSARTSLDDARRRPTTSHGVVAQSSLPGRRRHLKGGGPPSIQGLLLRCAHPRCGKTSCVACGAEVREGVVHRCVPRRRSRANDRDRAGSSSSDARGAPQDDGSDDDDDDVDHHGSLVGGFVVHGASSASLEAGGLVRSCPRCHTTFLKERGCNRVRCPTCEASTCYVCRGHVADYGHFCLCDCEVNRRGLITRASSGVRRAETCRACGKCSLWFVDDDREQQPKKQAARGKPRGRRRRRRALFAAPPQQRPGAAVPKGGDAAAGSHHVPGAGTGLFSGARPCDALFPFFCLCE